MRRLATGAVLVLVLALATACTQALGTLPGGTRAAALDVNDAGVAVGWSNAGTAPSPAPVRFGTDGAVTALPVGAADQGRGQANAVDATGAAAGGAGTAAAEHAVWWDTAGVVHDLGQLSGRPTRATDLHGDGWVVGTADDPASNPRPWWAARGHTSIAALPLPAGATSGDVQAVGARGIAVGSVTYGDGRRHGAYWVLSLTAPITVTDVTPTLADAWFNDVLDNGWAVGGYRSDGRRQPFLFGPEGGFLTLPIDGHDGGEAMAASGSSIVGFVEDWNTNEPGPTPVRLDRFAVRWGQPNQPLALVALQGIGADNVAYGVNAGGTIVGTSGGLAVRFDDA